jgi:hypothetical protein
MGGVRSLPLGAKVGVTLILPLIAALIWAWGATLFYNDRRRGWPTLLCYGAVGTALMVLGVLAGGAIQPYYR